MLEFILALGVVGIIISVAIEQINKALNEQHLYLAELRSALFQPLPQAQWLAHNTDVFSQRVSNVTDAFDYLVDVDFPTADMKSVAHEQSPYVLARLTHGWQSESTSQLVQRPAKLTATYHLNQLGLGSILDVISVIPLVNELNSNSLQLGKVDADQVPANARCGNLQCQ